jgi:hypothetical protein
MQIVLIVQDLFLTNAPAAQDCYSFNQLNVWLNATALDSLEQQTFANLAIHPANHALDLLQHNALPVQAEIICTVILVLPLVQSRTFSLDKVILHVSLATQHASNALILLLRLVPNAQMVAS